MSKGINKYGASGLQLDSQLLDGMMLDYIAGLTINGVSKKYNLTHKSIKRLFELNKQKMLDLRREYAIERDKQVREAVMLKRAEIMDNISAEDIKRASLSSKTKSALDLTQIKRIESGETTQNIALAIKDMNKEQLIEWLIQGQDVNNAVTPPTSEPIDAKEGNETEIDAK